MEATWLKIPVRHISVWVYVFTKVSMKGKPPIFL
jgi:hypothetical protein